ncbi:hypothetical protein QFZ23_002228 [Arthrobacter globiformis]|uniref:HD domain-containing protein n=1 Tax=Arthrobacter globiformis TaxID=1665 RepID=UPI002785A1C0|nr:HD domain-containing protein [Arthrobacter globiformis]MDQ1058327.1 hypothetical protein [Arthrobacter globiformis]
MSADDPLIQAGKDLISSRLHPAIINHSIRVFGFAQAIAEHEGCAVDLQALQVAALFHDAGTAKEYDGPHRFEIEGADAAAGFLGERGWDASRVDAVWEAIALHTSPQIAERRGPLTRYLRLGVRVDFGDETLLPHTARYRSTAEALHPRLMIEQELGNAVVKQAARNPAKAPPASWPGALLQAHLADPNQSGVNPAF